jgi:hypothetical protein
MFSFGFLQIITKPTRIHNDSATIIDHILTNSSRQVFNSFILCSRISDHFPILHVLDYAKPVVNPKSVSFRSYSENNMNNFKLSLGNFGWNDVLSTNDTQAAYNTFSDTFLSLHDIHFPNKTVKFNKNIHNIEPWMTTGLLLSRRQKNFLCKQSLSAPSDININRFKIYRNVYNTTIRAAKKIYYENELLLNKSNLKKTWQTLHSLIKQKSHKSNSCTSLFIDGKTCSDPLLLAEHFNKFFS